MFNVVRGLFLRYLFYKDWVLSLVYYLEYGPMLGEPDATDMLIEYNVIHPIQKYRCFYDYQCLYSCSS